MKKFVIKNRALKPYHFSYCTRGRIATFVVPPGEVAIREDQLEELRKIKTFEILEDEDHAIFTVREAQGEPKTRKGEVIPDAKESITGKAAGAEEQKPKKVKKSTKLDLESL